MPSVRLGRRGTTASEFALAAVPATLMMYAVMEVSWQLITYAALDHATLRASRFGALGENRPAGLAAAPLCRSAAIPWYASAITGGLLRPERLTVTTRSFANFITTQDPAVGTAGPGSGGQVVTYALSYRQPWLLGGLVPLVTGVDAMTFSATLVIKNEPFSNATC